MKTLESYDREAAVAYAHRWAYGRNPGYYNYDKIGGDCTNYASQCLLAGKGVMNYQPIFGWFYAGANHKAPAWTGVAYLYNFLTRTGDTVGPKARECRADEIQPGDLIQLSFLPGVYSHTPVVVAAVAPFVPENILVAAHTMDTDYRPVSTYEYESIRFLHIEGVQR